MRRKTSFEKSLWFFSGLTVVVETVWAAIVSFLELGYEVYDLILTFIIISLLLTGGFVASKKSSIVGSIGLGVLVGFFAYIWHRLIILYLFVAVGPFPHDSINNNSLSHLIPALFLATSSGLIGLLGGGLQLLYSKFRIDESKLIS
jgi:hypothetical protein